MAEGWDSIQRNYLKVPETRLDRKRKKEVLLKAKELLMNSDQLENFDLTNVWFDNNPGMPKAFSYQFVHFAPLPSKLELKGETYLVVFSRLGQRIIYSDVFKAPEGDPFYRYHSILQKISQ